ncbi:MAG: hypothetical protein KJI72_00140 [Patescibacteria group bacterium]|nr:hypothetical protein [Patescibacteria group bacterium]
MIIKFTIHGNQEYYNGNPVPFQRMLNYAWRRASTRYVEWQQYVRDQYFETRRALGLQAIISDNGDPNGIEMVRTTEIKPFNTKRKAQMDIEIYWKNNAHGDPDNVWKGVADALFKDDKNLDGSFKSQVAKNKKGRVEVKITI